MTTWARYVAALSALGAGVVACGGNAEVAAPVADAAAGAAGSGAGGVGGKPCDYCGPLEECFDSSTTLSPRGQLCVAKSVPVPGGYSIDATEVTYSQYEQWRILFHPSKSDEPDECQWNYDFDTHCVGDMEETPWQNPVVGVNWCIAYTYCKTVGKRLCGRIGGGPTPWGAAADASQSQWYNACSSGGLYAFPYGDSYSASACWGPPTEWPQEVATTPECQSPVPGYLGVYDLGGNAIEWEDSCSADECLLRGGAVGSFTESNYMRCDHATAAPRDGGGCDTGFRCCKP